MLYAFYLIRLFLGYPRDENKKATSNNEVAFFYKGKKNSLVTDTE